MKDCIHYEACKGIYRQLDESLFYEFEEKSFCKDCENYQSTHQVVKCKDCKYFLKVGSSHICQKFSEAVYNIRFYNIRKEEDFCSYGEKE